MKIYIGCKKFDNFQNFTAPQWYPSGNVYVYNQLLLPGLHLIVAAKSPEGKHIAQMMKNKATVQEFDDYFTSCLLRTITPEQMREVLTKTQEDHYAQGKLEKQNEVRAMLGMDTVSLARERVELKRNGYEFH